MISPERKERLESLRAEFERTLAEHLATEAGTTSHKEYSAYLHARRDYFNALHEALPSLLSETAGGWDEARFLAEKKAYEEWTIRTYPCLSLHNDPEDLFAPAEELDEEDLKHFDLWRYEDQAVQGGWEAWEARAKQASPAAPDRVSKEALAEENAQLRAALVACGREFHELTGVHCAARIALKEWKEDPKDEETIDSALVQLEGAAEASQPLFQPYSLIDSLVAHGMPSTAASIVGEGLKQRTREFLDGVKSNAAYLREQSPTAEHAVDKEKC